MTPLLPEISTVLTSPDPGELRLANPSLVALQSGRMLLSADQVGPGVKSLPGKKGTEPGSSRRVQGLVLGSADAGETWVEKDRFPFGHGRMFRDPHGICVLGHLGSAQITRSTNGGETWGKPASLSRAGDPGYALGPANVLNVAGTLYAAFMKNSDPDQRGNPASTLAPVVWKADPGANLTDGRSWHRSEACPPFRRWVPNEDLDHVGIPYFAVPKPNQGTQIDKRRWAFRTGWQDTHVVQLPDPAHAWHDPEGRTFHLLSTAHTHRSNVAILSRMVEAPDGTLKIDLQRTPAGTRWVFLPVPGGHQPFAIFYDEPSRLFWLIGVQATDSLCRPGKLGRGRRGLPCEETHRWQLCYSRNLVDWCFAGCLLADRPTDARYSQPTATTHGNDLHLAFRRQTGSKDQRTDAIVFGTVAAFRELAY